MMFVGESPIRKSIWETSGDTPTYIIIGTMTGAISAHWAEPEVMKRLSSATMATSAANMTSGGNDQCWSSSEPLMAVHTPKFDHSNQARNCATAKKRTSMGTRVSMPLAINSGTSAKDFTVPAAKP